MTKFVTGPSLATAMTSNTVLAGVVFCTSDEHAPLHVDTITSTSASFAVMPPVVIVPTSPAASPDEKD